jgi:C-terminal processing protease CtpA/Prc
VDTTFLNRLNFGDIPFNVAVPNFTSNIQKQDGTYFYTNHTNLKLLQPKDKAFKGDVYILINGGTFSSAAEFASMAHHNKRAVFIGEEAGGGYLGNCSLGTPTLTLPQSKIRILIPLAKYELAVKEVIPFGHGVLPDFQTSYTLSDILQNTDKDLELCLEIIGEN